MIPTPQIAQLVERYGALQHPVEVASLLRHLAKNPPSVIVEVGVWRGGNAAILKTAFPDVRLIGVDCNDIEDPRISDQPSLDDAIQRFGIEYVQGGAEDVGTVERVQGMLGGAQADYLFIDAAHDYDSVKRDFELWSPLTHQVGFHDLFNPDVYRFWRELTGYEAHGTYQRSCAFWKELDGLGIGLVLM